MDPILADGGNLVKSGPLFFYLLKNRLARHRGNNDHIRGQRQDLLAAEARLGIVSGCSIHPSCSLNQIVQESIAAGRNDR